MQIVSGSDFTLIELQVTRVVRYIYIMWVWLLECVIKLEQSSPEGIPTLCRQWLFDHTSMEIYRLYHVLRESNQMHLELKASSLHICVSHNLITLSVVYFQSVFFGGVDSSLRKEIWPFLLHYYPYDSTHEQREQIRNDKFLQYQRVRMKR